MVICLRGKMKPDFSLLTEHIKIIVFSPFCSACVIFMILIRIYRMGKYTIYTNQNHKYHAENLIFYSIEQKGLFTDPGRRADSPQSTPMGSRCLLFLLSVNACGSSQGESRRNVISNPKKAKFALRERFQVSGVEICPGVVKVDESVLFCFQSFSSYFPVIYQTFYKNLFPVRYHVKRLEKDWTFHFSCVILEKTKNPRR